MLRSLDQLVLSQLKALRYAFAGFSERSLGGIQILVTSTAADRAGIACRCGDFCSSEGIVVRHYERFWAFPVPRAFVQVL